MVNSTKTIALTFTRNKLPTKVNSILIPYDLLRPWHFEVVRRVTLLLQRLSSIPQIKSLRPFREVVRHLNPTAPRANSDRGTILTTLFTIEVLENLYIGALGGLRKKRPRS